MSQFHFKPVFESYSLVVALTLVLVFTLLIAPKSHKTTRGKHWILIALRLGVFALVVLELVRPMRIEIEVEKKSATLIVLLDRSRSMQALDAYGGKSRWDALKTMIEESLPDFQDLGEDLQIKFYQFDEDAEEVDFAGAQLELVETPEGDQTAIGAVLDETIRLAAGHRIAGVILISDGTEQTSELDSIHPQRPVDRLADLGYPLYTIVFGQARAIEQGRDVELGIVYVPNEIYEKIPLVVDGKVRIRGYVNQDILVQLFFGPKAGKMEQVASTRVRATQNGQKVDIENLSYVPQKPGQYKWEVRVVTQDGEVDKQNNQQNGFVKVVEGGLNVLYLEGQYRVEQGYLTRSLDASPNIHVDSVLINHRDPKNHPYAFEKLERYNVFILGDIDSKVFRPQDLKTMIQTVENGAGFIMLGGDYSFGPGGYGDTALAKLLPIRLDRLERQRFNEPIRDDLHLKGPLKMVPTQIANLHYRFMLLGEEAQNLDIWSKLPPLDGANRFDFANVKRNAAVVAETGKGSKPLLLASTLGKGRVLAFAGDSTWRWHSWGFKNEHIRFWRQLMFYLANKHPAKDANVRIQLDANKYHADQTVTFTVSAFTPEGKGVKDATFTTIIKLPDSSQKEIKLSRRGEKMLGSFSHKTIHSQMLKPGNYSIEVTARKDGSKLGVAVEEFTITVDDREKGSVANPTRMANWANTTKKAGGRPVPPKDLPELLQELKQLPQKLEVKKEVKITYYDKLEIFLLFVTLLGLEWFLRKKWRLV